LPSEGLERVGGILLNEDELKALQGLSHLHLALYVMGIRRYMDYQTGITGIKRRLSWQGLKEEMYIEPARGIKTKQKLTRFQLVRAIKQLEKIGLIRKKGKLVFECLLASSDESVQNKAARKPHKKTAYAAHKAAPEKVDISNENKQNREIAAHKAAQNFAEPAPKAALPPSIDNIDILDTNVSNISPRKFQENEFSRWYAHYPKKYLEEKAKQEFIRQKLYLKTDDLIADLQARLARHPSWQCEVKFIPNAYRFLREKHFKDAIIEDTRHGNAANRANSARSNSIFAMLDSCASAGSAEEIPPAGYNTVPRTTDEPDQTTHYPRLAYMDT
jgi:hypothetical protein